MKITLIRQHVSERMCAERLIERDILDVSMFNQYKQIEEEGNRGQEREGESSESR